MKKFTVLLIVLLSCYSEAQQYYYTFSELKGMEDQSNNTHLFYRLYHFHGNFQTGYSEWNSIYHFDLNSQVDSFYLPDNSYYYPIMGGYGITVHNFDLWNSDPSKYIYCYTSSYFSNSQKINSPTTAIERFDGTGFSWISGYANAGISKQNDSLVYGVNGNLMKSLDGGLTWNILPNEEFFFLSLDTQNDQVIFIQDYDGKLFKSTDGGLNSFIVDTSSSRIYNNSGYNTNQFLFDNDSIHIYRVYQYLNQYFFTVSNNNGEPFTWGIKYFSDNKIYINIDYSQSGSIYLADERYIYHSTDYGSTFNEYKVLDRRIVGIYKKSNSDKLYAATKYDLYEITPDTILTIKHLAVDPDLFAWYPFEVGNKWIYDYWYEIDTSFETGISVQEITGDTTVNGKHYFIFNNSNNYIRLDSLTGRIYKSNNPNIQENLFTDLTLDIGDTLYDSTNYQRLTVIDEQAFNQWGLNTQQKFFNDFSSSITHTFSFVKGIGLYNEFIYELGGGEIELKGAVIDGIIYGDTTTVGVNDPPQQVNEFSLSQNYPNPFNPNTKIRYSIPNVTQSGVEGFLVTLKVYDVLGREVATLVNEEKQPGVYEVEFNGSNLSSGIYFYNLKAGDFNQTKKLILMK